MIVEPFRETIPDAIAAALAILCAHFDKPKDLDVLRSYARIIEKRGAPPALLEAAIERVIETRTFFPSLSELLNDIDAVRQIRLAASPFVPCAECARHQGWMEVKASGQITTRHLGRTESLTTKVAPRLERCACYLAWRLELASRGLLLPEVTAETALPGFTAVADLARERICVAR